MKSTTIKKVGSVLAGTAFLGAALSAPVMAGMDTAGVDKGFFYDQNFSPVVQIVVGEKVGDALDFVAAGNIAATVGNLAYVTKTVSSGEASGTAEGQVVITTSARGAVGDYVQDTDIEEDTADFYDNDAGFFFEGEKTYERGDFTTYTLSCEQSTRTEASLLKEGTYTNVHCLFCHNLCMEALENPAHDMAEEIIVDSDKIYYYEDGIDDDDSEALKMAIEKDAISYKVDTDFIPMERVEKDPTESNCDGEDCYIDFEYRGKMLLFGNDNYYVKDIKNDEIYLAEGKVLDDVTSEGFASEYNGYKFQIDNLIFAEEFTVAGMVLNVQKPDGTIIQTQISKMANSPPIDGKLELAGVTASESASLQTASIIVYDLETEVILKDGEDLEINGEVKDDWQVAFETVTSCEEDADCDIDDYDDMDDADLLKSITITYTHALDGDEALEANEALAFPYQFTLTFKGYLSSDYDTVPCVGAGEGNIVLEKGDSDYQLEVSFTGEDNNRYNNVRLDEGPFKKNDLFIVDGVVYTFDSYEKEKNEGGDTDDTVDVTLDPQIRGNRLKFKEMQRYCDPEDDGVTGDDETYMNMDCQDIGDDGEITLRELAFTDAMKDDDPTEYENDDDLEVDVHDLYIEKAAMNGLDLIFNENDNTIFYATDFDYDEATDSFGDEFLAVNPDMVGAFDDFDTDGYELELSLLQEADLLDDPDSELFVAADDLNDDGDDDDTLVVFEVEDGVVVIDLADRDYDDDIDSDFSTSASLQTSATDITTQILEIDEDIDTLLITPDGGDKFTFDWGSDDRLDAVELCHPEDKVDVTYFLGTTEEETIAESTITKADEGKEVSAGCCTFTVSEFDVSVSGVTGGDVSTTQVNPIVGNLVVSESAADTSKNLVIVGGPSVNGLCSVSKEEIQAASGQYVVKKDGKLLIVAGWTADDTQAAGNELIKWLKNNVH